MLRTKSDLARARLLAWHRVQTTRYGIVYACHTVQLISADDSSERFDNWHGRVGNPWCTGLAETKL
jgi:hypothetical protein